MSRQNWVCPRCELFITTISEHPKPWATCPDCLVPVHGDNPQPTTTADRIATASLGAKLLVSSFKGTELDNSSLPDDIQQIDKLLNLYFHSKELLRG